MQQITRLIWAGMFVVLCVMASDIYAQSEPGERPVELRAKQFAHAVSSGDPKELKQLVIENFGENLQKIPMSAHIAVLMSYWDMSRGLDFYELQKAQAHEAVAVFKNRLTGGWNGIWFKVEPQPPYRIVAIGPGAAEPPQRAARKLTDTQIAREFDAFMRRLAQADVFSGAVALGRDGAVVFEGAYGQADKNSNVARRLDTKYHLASMSKMFTAVAIAQLVEHGLLSFDDPLSKFLPDFPDKESSKKILIKHLLS